MPNALYNVLNNSRSSFDSFASGVDARQGMERNKLAQEGMRSDLDQRKRLNVLADEDKKNQEDLAGAEQILSSPRPAEALRQLFPHLYQEGVTDEQVLQGAQQVKQQAMMKLGQREQQGPQLNALKGDNGETLYTYGNSLQVVKPEKPQEDWRAKAQYENQLAIQRDAAKPAAQDNSAPVQVVGPDGKPQYVSRTDAIGKEPYVGRDKPSAADEKWKREVKTKIPRLNAAIRRMDRLEQAVDKIGQNKAFDGGELDKFVVNRTEDGRELVAAAAQLMPELQALTRTPGIGSQSDLETRLANLQFPSSEFPPEVNRKNAAELRAFLNDLRDAYTGAEQEIQGGEVQSLLDKYAPQ